MQALSLCRSSNGPETRDLADTALTIAFHGNRPPPHPVLPSSDQLDEMQQIVVRGLAEVGEDMWADSWFSGGCRQRGVPGSREDCRRYAGLPT